MAGTVYPSRAPGFTPGFDGVCVAHNFNFVCLCPVSCVPMLSVTLDCPFLIAHSLTFI